MSATHLEPAAQTLASQLIHEQVFSIYRRWGYLQARLDPLGQYLSEVPLPEDLPEVSGPLEATVKLEAESARRVYCGTVGAEFMHIPDRRRREWIAARLEAEPSALDKNSQRRVLNQLIRADLFEQVIQSRYLGTKRFSLEGVTALIPFLDELLNRASTLGAVKAVMGMSHRGRLSVMVNTFGKQPSHIFSKFEDVDPRSYLGGGDVKYHVGATSEYTTREGKQLALHLVSNPSHLEAVDPVAMGRARAKQVRIGEHGMERVLLISIHGDAAFAGQGVTAETLNLGGIPGYSVGGTIHVIVNNLIGFTAEPDEVTSTRFCSDAAKRLPVPVFHVNAEDPEAVVRIAALAADYRYEFQSDVVIDLIGYRRHGHSEVDDPTITQPLRYALIKKHLPLHELYARQLGVDIADQVREVQAEFIAAQRAATEIQKITSLSTIAEYWSPYKGGPWKPEYEVATGLGRDEIKALADKLASYPSSFRVHAKLKKLLEQRAEMGAGLRPIDYGMAEAVAFASLLKAGTAVRLSGQDSERGTFNQRHSVLIDTVDETPFIPLNHVAEVQAAFEVYNSALSEAGVLGFEYGYSRDTPEALVLWEAQFGDFANGAQVVIDQFIASGEDKWGLLSHVVLLLPHGYEGQGPEHSSARVERYLQLAARENMQIAQPSTAAQYFHLLRRQMLRPWRKPLVVFTPKSMLRHPSAVSPIEDFTISHFQNVLPETQITDAQRLLICTGKIGHELRVEREKRGDTSTGIIFVEQLYPWPEAELCAAIDAHPESHEVVWVQEEPENMGPLSFVMPRLRRMVRDRHVLSIKRSAAASPATGSPKAHEMEQRTLIDLALSHGLHEKANSAK
jgi:2-oxoglutarate dehydrogenase E1 component